MKRILGTLLVAVMLLSFAVSCGNSVTYKNDVRAESFSSVEKDLPLGDNIKFSTVGELTAKVSEGLKTVLADGTCDDHLLRFTAGASFDEYGVLHFKTAEDAKNGLEAAKTYIKSKADDALYRSYFPGEESKLDEAEARIYGNYVVYAILSKENRAAFFAGAEALLKA